MHRLLTLRTLALLAAAAMTGCAAGGDPAGRSDTLVFDARDDSHGIYGGHFIDGVSGVEVSFRIDLSETVSYVLATADQPDLVAVTLADRAQPELASVTIAGADVTRPMTVSAAEEMDGRLLAVDAEAARRLLARLPDEVSHPGVLRLTEALARQLSSTSREEIGAAHAGLTTGDGPSSETPSGDVVEPEVIIDWWCVLDALLNYIDCVKRRTDCMYSAGLITPAVVENCNRLHPCEWNLRRDLASCVEAEDR